jgi:ATP adenylyltransferase
MEAMNQSITILETYLHNPGTNVGINIGDASSGGSIPDHLHVHIVPRWHGDTNFLPVVAETKHLSEDLRVIYETLKKPFDALEISMP